MPPPRPAYDPQPKLVPGPDEPVTAHLRTPPADALVRWHRHAWGQLACPRHGSIRVSAAGMTWIVPMFRAVWIPPGVEHEIVMLGQVEFHALYLEPKTSPLSLTDCSVIEVSVLMRALIDSLSTDESLPSRRRRLVMDLLIEEISAASSLPLGLPLPSDRRLKALCDAMMDDPGSSRSLGDWAPLVGASERTLARLFQSDLHISFGNWRRQLRLARAIDLICRGMPLLAVADELGYANAGAFSTMFRQALGFPPSRLVSASDRLADGGLVVSETATRSW
jgi:AraC-like DNA-binding protein